MGAEYNHPAQPGEMQPLETPAGPNLAGLLPAEAQAIKHRRQGIYADSLGPPDVWGLALSGGGIRSATFCLGVLQALAKAPFKQAPDQAGAQARSPTFPLLARFDFLSTVSGGGYVGGFFSALFRPRGKLASGTQPSQQEAAQAAYAALATDPPGRMGDCAQGDVPKDQPLRWLRENGRYLAPNNTGDLVYDIAIAVRNLCAVHYVIGITLLTVFLGMFIFRFLTVAVFKFGWSISCERLMQPADALVAGAIWWSPWLLATLIWIVLFLIPLGVAYWLHQEKPRASKTKIDPQILTAFVLLVLGWFALGQMRNWFSALPASSNQSKLADILLVFMVMLGIALAEAVIIKCLQKNNMLLFRSAVTRLLSHALVVTLGLTIVSVVETAGQTLYLWLQNSKPDPFSVFSLAGTLMAAVAAIRTFSPMLAQPGKNHVLAKLPINAVLTVLGLVILLLLLVAWHCVATGLFFGFQPLPLPSLPPAQNLLMIQTSAKPWELIAFCAAATAAGGYFLGFINLSSLQVTYSARLTRAYLGASNLNRFSQARTQKRVTEPHVDDDLTFKKYYENNHLGPAHIINVTINATTGSCDQLTQRDRQGIPLAITPAGVTVEGQLTAKKYAEELSIGQWMGISGAAFSTGVGRGTNLGTGIVFSLTNVRLGWWWNSGNRRNKFILPIWRNQVYLAREIRAYFPGKDGSHWYLSDGGHYENTAVLELLRRRLSMVVCCDCGADPNYAFEDLANLMRLARIDHGAEFQSIAPAGVPFFADRSSALEPYFANTAADLRGSHQQPAGSNNKCALLYKVSYPNHSGHTILVVIKPRLIDEAPLDLHQYQSQNADFPQQSTADQFFNEAQWESYRKLGVLIGSRIFGT